MTAPLPQPLGADQALVRTIVRKAKAGGVVPILGPDLLLVDGPAGREPIYTALTRTLARDYGLDAIAREPAPTLERLFGEAKRAGHPVHEFESDVAEAVLRLEREEPAIEALRLLAPVEWFRLFLSLTPDGLLRRALDVARFGGRPRTIERAYRLSDWEDVTREELRAETPIVYHLLGRAVALPDHFAVTEADAVEFFHHLQQPERQPRNLLDHLREKDLLVLGADLPDWLLRFLVRVGRGHPIRQPRRREEYMVQRDAPAPSLVYFLGSHAPETHCVGMDPLEPVRALYAAWATEHGDAASAPDPDDALRPGRYVFISYAHEDLVAAVQLQARLELARIPVWLDKDAGLRSGDDWDRRIHARIGQCGAFVPLLSRVTERRLAEAPAGEPPYFAREWAVAMETLRSRGAAGEGAVLPLAIDEEVLAHGAPAPFEQLQADAAPGGRPANAFVRRLARGLGVEQRVG